MMTTVAKRYVCIHCTQSITISETTTKLHTKHDHLIHWLLLFSFSCSFIWSSCSSEICIGHKFVQQIPRASNEVFLKLQLLHWPCFLPCILHSRHMGTFCSTLLPDLISGREMVIAFDEYFFVKQDGVRPSLLCLCPQVLLFQALSSYSAGDSSDSTLKYISVLESLSDDIPLPSSSEEIDP